MRSQFSSSSNVLSTHPVGFQQFLIPQFDRLKFTLLFVLATGLGWLLVRLILGSLQNPVLPLSLQSQGMLGTFVSGLVSGLVVGATQWLVLRRYMPDWLWILASSAGYIILMTTLQGWQNLLGQVITASEIPFGLAAFPPKILIVLVGVLGALLASLCAIWLGLAQWLVLRQYARPSWGWIFVPSIAVLLSSAFYGVSILLSLLKMPVSLEMGVLGAGVLGTTQAIALCALPQRPDYINRPANPILANSPEILNYRQVRYLTERLQRELNHAWKKEIVQAHALSYLVGVDETGAIAAYEPVNQLATDYANQTPLPNLLNSAAATDDGINTQPTLARFKVSFMPSGRLQVLSWRGIPLLWIAAGMLGTVIVLGAIAGYFRDSLSGFLGIS